MKNILLLLISFTLLSSCVNDSPEMITDEGIVSQLKTDSDFIIFFENSRSLKETIFLKLTEGGDKDLTSKISNASSLSDIMFDLDINQSVLDDLDHQSKLLVEKLNLRYPYLQERMDNEITDLFQLALESSDREKEPLLEVTRLTVNEDECDEDFEEDFHRIHDEYDAGVAVCLVVAMRTGLGGLIACNAGNVYRTASGVAKSIDKHTLCKEEKEN